MLIPKQMLPHTIGYREFLESDRMGKDQYADPVTIRNVRVDASAAYSRRAAETAEKASAVVYCYAARTTPFLRFRERSRIQWKGRMMTVLSAVELTHPLGDEIWGYELEVV